MELKIFANETQTVIEALEAYRKSLDNDISTVKNSTDKWSIDGLVDRLERKKETLTRVIDRLNEL